MAIVYDIIGNYRIVAELASGAFGTVYQGEHTMLTTRVVAIKLLHSTRLNSQKERDCFIQEALLLEKLKHCYILPIIDVGIHNGCPYLVTEYAPKGSLRDRLQRQRSQLLHREEILTILSQIGQALQHAHRHKIIHRDLKPENILFNTKGEALLADFGISTVYSTLSMQQATIIGTPAYMAPEQFKGLLCKESDEYALGCIAYELFTGQHPFIARDFPSWMFKHLMENPIAPTHLNSHLPAHIAQAILKAMAKERTERHADVAAFVAALRSSSISQTYKNATSQADMPKEPSTQALRSSSIPQKTKEQWLDEALVYDKAKRHAKALAAFEQAILLDPNYAIAYNGKGNVFYDLKRYQEALAAYNRAILLGPNYAIAYNGKGDVFYDLKRYQEALAAYNHAILLDPNYARAYNGKGLALRNLMRYKEALVAYDRAIQIDPNYARSYNGKGNTLKRLRRSKEAKQAYEKARQLGYKG